MGSGDIWLEICCLCLLSVTIVSDQCFKQGIRVLTCLFSLLASIIGDGAASSSSAPGRSERDAPQDPDNDYAFESKSAGGGGSGRRSRK